MRSALECDNSLSPSTMMNGFTLMPFPLSLSETFMSTTRPCNTYDVLVSNIHCYLQEWGLIRSRFSFSVLKSGEDVAISISTYGVAMLSLGGRKFYRIQAYLLSIQHKKKLDPYRFVADSFQMTSSTLMHNL